MPLEPTTSRRDAFAILPGTALLLASTAVQAASWSPDGSHLVFTTVVDGVHVIMRVDRDGSDLRAVSDIEEAAGDPDYSPDGAYLLYFTDEPLSRDLYMREVKTGAVTALTSTPQFEEASPRWAPDAERVAFVGTDTSEGAEGDIWTLNIRTGERKNATQSADVGEFHPDWSHDGSKLVYIRVKDGQFGVAVHDLASGTETVVAGGNDYAVLDPHFSLDDKYVTFTRTDFAEKGPGMPGIFRVSLVDGEEERIAKGLYLSHIAAK